MRVGPLPLAIVGAGDDPGNIERGAHGLAKIDIAQDDRFDTRRDEPGSRGWCSLTS